MSGVANNPLFRPPAEADSLILQLDQGCPYNLCTFCGMYRDLLYRRLPVEEARLLIRHETRKVPDTNRVFLADGDVMRRPFGELEALLRELGTDLPRLARVNVYATGRAILDKTEDQLRALRSLKLHTLYVGLESGDEETLLRVRKGETAAGMIEAGKRAQHCGLHISVMILLGLGGRERTCEHVHATAQALNHMQPRLLSTLRVVPVPGTELYDEIRAGRFEPLTEYEVVRELRSIMASLALTHTVFRANHTSNAMPTEGRLPRDQARLLTELDRLLQSNRLDRKTPGRMPLWL